MENERTCTMVSTWPSDYTWECSACGETHPMGHDFTHCPWCGARIVREVSLEEGSDDEAAERAAERKHAADVQLLGQWAAGVRPL